MAKTTGKINGTLILVDADGTTIGCSTNATFNMTNERLEDTCKDLNGQRTFSAGSQDWSLNVEGITKFETPSNISVILAAAKAATIIIWTWGTSNAEDPTISGEGFIDNFDWNAPLNQPSTWSFSVAPTGEITITNT
jgi:predicted secreted protein